MKTENGIALEVEPHREGAEKFASLEDFGAAKSLHKLFDTTINLV